MPQETARTWHTRYGVGQLSGNEVYLTSGQVAGFVQHAIKNENGAEAIERTASETARRLRKVLVINLVKRGAGHTLVFNKQPSF